MPLKNITSKKAQEAEIIEGKSELATLPQQNALDKPEADTKFAKEAARFLVDIIKQNNWSRKLGGSSEHIQYEGWQTAGKYYGYTVKTHDAEYVELGSTWGFKAKATVVNEHTGIEVGSAEAYCMSDEYNWKNKPKFQLASMAQTRSGSKALRQILGFVVALAGFNPTPTEEMDGVVQSKPSVKMPLKPVKSITDEQKGEIIVLLGKLGKTSVDLNKMVQWKFKLIDDYKKMTEQQAEYMIAILKNRVNKLPVGTFVSPDDVPNTDTLTDEDLATIDTGMEQQRLAHS